MASNFKYNLTHEDNELLKGVRRTESLSIILKLANKSLNKVLYDNANLTVYCKEKPISSVDN